MTYSKVLKVRDPYKAHDTDAGIDFFIPENTYEFKNQFEEKNPDLSTNKDGIIMKPHDRVLIPSGIKMNIPKDYALIAFNKSGISSRLGLDVLASVVDHGYQGQIHISLHNSSEDTVVLTYGTKIIQFVLLPIKHSELKEVDESLLFEKKSNRGNGGFGSSGV